VDEAISVATEDSELARLRTLRAKLERVLKGLGYCREGGESSQFKHQC
jgi:hypothetical protein